eukprot:TRINITY_DN20040_c0_g1_i2.p1 TRINITY_DN20040_c0_g1~~TRINITY_DN20040_c0_g1_i2.p1  ORF type:complete len:976 (-),score=201.17 TRINITY_DN20040_c0_g1_i2:13-2940(-)
MAIAQPMFMNSLQHQRSSPRSCMVSHSDAISHNRQLLRYPHIKFWHFIPCYVRRNGARQRFCVTHANANAHPNTNCDTEKRKKGEQKQKQGRYPFQEIEPRWQRYWEENQTFCTPDELDTSKPKYYVLDMFPYPSGAGLHVGHPEGYTATDIISRYKRMQGFNVLHPMGWDAFGLPAEQYAIETGTHPKVTTSQNIKRFRDQLKSLGFSYDWNREICTTEPEYYKWTQWIFLQLLKKGLAYQAEVPVNWCPALGTVLANEEVVDGVSERGGHPVIRKPMLQWMLKITDYADRLLQDLDELDWPESIKEMQQNWIGRSEGAELDFHVIDSNREDMDLKITVYTTRPDTIFGVTYLVVAPEHPLLSSIVSGSQKRFVDEYCENAYRKSDLERTELQKDKSGIFTGSYARNHASDEMIPIWVADYVLGSYGTGAIMAVAAHDSRDFEFAKKYSLPIRHVVVPRDGGQWSVDEVYTEQGMVVNSFNERTGFNLNGLPTSSAAENTIKWFEKSGRGRKKVNYKLRDWLFARQRYWGEPFPVLFLKDTNEVVAVPEKDLPVVLPEMDDFSPSGTGEPPLSKCTSWVNTMDPISGKPAKRETNTMPQWAGSCWYYLRFMDPRNSECLVDKEKERYWSPVDVYVGGAEHSVLHLLYARFWHKVLYDIGVVSTKEPFKCLINQGMILGEFEYTAFKDSKGKFVSADLVGNAGDYQQVRVPDRDVMKVGESYTLMNDPSIRLIARAHKMSKSRGNVVNPDVIVNDYGADSLRLYEMFMGPLRDTKVWSTKGVEGVHRFLARTWRLIVGPPSLDGSFNEGTVTTDIEPNHEQLRDIHQCIRKVTEEIENTRFNTAISTMMEFVNTVYKWPTRPREVLESFILLLSPFAPHISEELWRRMGHIRSLAYEQWPQVDDQYLKKETIDLPIQINGRTRGIVKVPAGSKEEDIFKTVVEDKHFEKYLNGSSIKKRIYVPGRILNIVIHKNK